MRSIETKPLAGSLFLWQNPFKDTALPDCFFFRRATEVGNESCVGI